MTHEQPRRAGGAVDLGELEAVAAKFGVDAEQVRRDHFISHVLAVLAAHVPTDDVVFSRGTALSRTYLTDGRLSEDIDLIALAPRGEVAERIERTVPLNLRRTFGRVSWTPPLSQTSGSAPAEGFPPPLRGGLARGVPLAQLPDGCPSLVVAIDPCLE